MPIWRSGWVVNLLGLLSAGSLSAREAVQRCPAVVPGVVVAGEAAPVQRDESDLTIWMHEWREPTAAELATQVDRLETGPRVRALELVERDDSTAVRRYRQGFLQRATLSGTWLYRSGAADLGLSKLDTSLTVAVPITSFDNLLLLTPGFQVDWLDGPQSVDVPPQLYRTGLGVIWRRQWTPWWGSVLAVHPVVASDFRASDEALRITGRGLATWQWIPERLTLVLGVAYLDRNDISLLPAAGFVWTPTPQWRLDAVFPLPKLAYRFDFMPTAYEHWIYLAGKLGGQTWAVQRATGVNDQLTLRDYRLSLGVERVTEGGGGGFAEVGYVFGRSLEYTVVPAELDFPDSILLEAGVRY